MRNRISYRREYMDRWARYPESWERLMHDDVFERNKHLPSDIPGTSVSACLLASLQCLYAAEREYADVLLRRTINHADRLISENRYLDTDIAEAGHPRNLAEILCGRAYAKWLLGEVLDRVDIRRGSEHYVTWCRTKAEDRRNFNDSFTMSYYLAGVRAAMIACDLDYAGELLKAPDRFRWHHAREFDLWRRLVAMYPEVTDEFDEEFETLFDMVRDPDFVARGEIRQVFVRGMWVTLETGIIREMYIINASPHDNPDPEAVLAAVAR